MKVLILYGSAHKNGATEILANEFANGAENAGHEITKIKLSEKNINDCTGCGACQINGGSCVQKDDMTIVYKQMLDSDIIVFASPVYFYTWTSLMKRTIDRTFALLSTLNNKQIYLISSGAATGEEYMQTMFNSYNQYFSCLRGEGNKNMGIFMAYGINTPSDVVNSDYPKMAYDLGNKIK